MAKKSLMSETALVPVGGLPAVFDAPPDDMAGGGKRSAYVTFASQKSPSWGKLAAAVPGLQEPQPVLIRPDPYPPVALTPFRFHLIAAKQYWVRMNDAGDLIEVTRDRPEGETKLIEFIETLALVHHGGGLTAARVTFKRGMSGAAKTAVASLKLAATPEWGKLSPEHEASLSFPKPFGRFVVEVTAGKRVSLSSGYKYGFAGAAVSAAGPDEWVSIQRYFANEDTKQEFDTAYKGYERRISELEGLAG